MKIRLVKILALTCLLFGTVGAKADGENAEKRVWEETSRSGMTEFVTAVTTAGFVDEMGNITSAGIGYAGLHAIGQDLVVEIVPQSHHSFEGLGRLLFIYNGLYNNDGSVRESITIDEFVVIGQGIGWYVPVQAPVFHKLMSLNQALLRLNERSTAGQMVAGEIDTISTYLKALTGRNLSAQFDPAVITTLRGDIEKGLTETNQKTDSRFSAVNNRFGNLESASSGLRSDIERLSEEKQLLQAQLQKLEEGLSVFVETTSQAMGVQHDINQASQESIQQLQEADRQQGEKLSGFMADVEKRYAGQRNIINALMVVIGICVLYLFWQAWSQRPKKSRKVALAPVLNRKAETGPEDVPVRKMAA